jgi:predicted phosphodiesterase
MRYAIVSDLHANLQAWNAVLLDIRSSRVDHIICLGDLIGYGPSPAAVLQSAHEHIHSFVMGNHDAVICGKLDDDLFSDQAQETLQWTRTQLGNTAINVLSSFPLMLDGGAFLCTHGHFLQPESFAYILGPDDAESCWNNTTHPLLFAGHTHEPALFLQGASRIPRQVTPQDFELEPAKRYLVNVGSVGSPRDRDPRASYCIHDTKSNAVYWRRIPYDLDAHRREYERIGRDPETSVVLRADPRRNTTPLRERLDFAPPRSAAKSATNVIDVVSIQTLHRRARRWKTATTVLVTLLGLASGAWGFWWQQTTPRPALIHEKTITPILTQPDSDCPNLIPAPPIPPHGHPVPGWTLALGDSRFQNITLESDPRTPPTFVLTSTSPTEELAILPAPIEVVPGMSFYPDVFFAKSTNFNGTIGITVSLTRNESGRQQVVQQFYTHEPGLPRADGWARARRKFVIPAGGIRIQLKLGGHFTGTVKIRNITLGHSAKRPAHPTDAGSTPTETAGAGRSDS